MSRRAIAALLFCSGATGLVYEVVWSKLLSDVLGNSGQAHAIVLATFMGGLALGAWLFGGLADRLQRPLALYAFIEVGVGLYALVFPAVHGALEAAFLSVAPGFSESARVVPKLFFAALALVPPTVAMGGTMPAMLKHATREDPSIRTTLARLYAVNSVGAAVGAWLAGTVWIPNAGLSATTRAAGAINLALGAIALWLARRSPLEADVRERPEDGEETYGPAEVRAALFGLALSGFTAMLYETGWIRLVTLVVGASSYAFTWIVCAFILGISLGSTWVARRPGADSLRLFGRLQAAIAVTLCLTLPLYLRVPYLFLKVRGMLARTEGAFPAWQALLFAVSLVVMLAPTFVMGAAFPVGARVVAKGHATVGRRIGWVWAVNTVGTVLGALLGGLWLMPALGVEALFTLGLVLTLLGAFVALQAAGGTNFRLVPVGVGVAVFALYAVAFRGWAPVLARLSPFRASPAILQGRTVKDYVQLYLDTQVQDFVRDDTFATVFVGHVAKNPAHRFLLVNGKPDASTGPGDQVTQALLGQLGLLLVPQPPKKVLVVGAGAGFTVASALSHPVERVDLVEISPGVLEAARLFADVNRGALDDPRTHLHVDDARTFLALSGDRYDVIISEPSNPWVAGISSLFTQEFFEIVDRHLAEGGVLVQWIHTYEMSDELVRLVMRTLRTHFPHVTGWQGGDGDLLLLASRAPLSPDYAELARRVALPAVKADLGRLEIAGVDGVLALQVMTEGLAEDYAGKGPLNRDDHNLLEYRAPVAFFADEAAQVPDARRTPRAFPHLLITPWLAGHPLDAARAGQLARAVASGQNADFAVRRSAAAAWVEHDPSSNDARKMLAAIATEQGEPQVALRALDGVSDTPQPLREEARALEAAQTAGPWSPREAVTP
ncbi:MAG: fused MFS/spermidine synthase [Myxococcales bacterium]|nr:fused MFS/spermidine synthase [Myxococcales bacterium]